MQVPKTASIEAPWSRLTPAVFRQIAQSLHPNEVILSFKLVSKEVAECLRDEYKTFQLRQKQDVAAPDFCPILCKAVSARVVAAQPWPGAEFVAHWGRPEPWRALNRRQRHTLLCLAASSGHAASLAAALEHCGTVVKADALASAAAVGDVAAFRRLLLRGGAAFWDMDAAWLPAAAGGQLKLLKFLDRHNLVAANSRRSYVLGPAAAKRRAEAAACFGGRERVLSWMERVWCQEEDRLDRAARHVAAAAAAEGGQAELLKRLVELVGKAKHRHRIVRGIAYGCPLPVLQQYCRRWGGLEDGAGARTEAAVAASRRQELLLRAATSPTSDWAAKHLTAAHGLELPAEAVEAAGTAGDVDAASFCLGLPPVLSMVPGPAGQDGWHAPAEVLALAAASAGQVAVLRLLKERGVTLGWAHVQAAMEVGNGIQGPDSIEMEPEFAGLPSLRYLVMEGGLDAAAAGAVNWSDVFRCVAWRGADTPLLQHLVEQRGAEVDLEAVARGGSEEQLGWALAVRRTRRTSKARAAKVVEAALLGGNWAAAGYLKRRNWDPRNQQQLQELFRSLARGHGTAQHIPALAWLLDNYQLVWTLECVDAVEELGEAADVNGWRIPRGHEKLLQAMLAQAYEALGEPEYAGSDSYGSDGYY
ncbi:hypothetical protein HYH02_000512 [Chlamydomonas schloesseri]|uniref:Uncharacterized protein n=1 Tax=Chlamydomonas schloesseri TaxID=2026947 RepID=A0A836BCX7_9CHLO|nr:hypothetical protein HYH02_000512 [Chlamydomonas schloesseri]|eukprot:KAG2454673.1 hypothetical protein HYH02_000512 [Chlamydomonas schloesseri]